MSPLGYRSTEHLHKLVSIKTNFDDVIEPSTERSKGESSNKDGDETILNN